MVRLCAVLIAFLLLLPCAALAQDPESPPTVAATDQPAEKTTDKETADKKTAPAKSEEEEPVIEIEVRGERERPARVDVIGSQQIEQMPNVQNYADALQRLPGTQTLTGCLMNSPRPSFRGSSYTWLQVLVEGIPVNPIGSCVLNRVPATAMKELEVLRGPASPKYPGNTVSGLVWMTLKTGDEYPGGQLKVTGGGFGNEAYEFSAGGGTARSNYFMGYNRSQYDGWMPERHPTDLSDLSFKVVSSPDDRSKLTLVGTYLSGEKQGFRPSGPNPFDKWEHRWPNLSRPAASITYTRQLSPRSDILLRVSPLTISYDLQYQQWDRVNLREVAMQTRMRYALLRTEFQHNLTLSPENLLSWGGWWQKDRSRTAAPAAAPAWGDWSTRTQTWQGVFVQDTFSRGDRSAITLGLRHDGSDPGQSALSPFLSAHWRTGANTGVRFAVTRNRRFPMLDELYGSGVNTGNPDLKPPSAWNYEIDLEQRTRSGQMTLALFRQDHRDMVLLDPTYTFQNIGRARIEGVEVGYEGRLRAGSWWANYSLLDAEDLTKDRPLVLAYRTAPPRHMAKAGMTLKGSQGFTYTLEALHYGARPTDVDTPTFVGEPWNVTVPTRVPAYTVFNCRISKALSSDRSLFLSVENLFDRDYDEILFYQKPGRWINFGISQSFH